MYLKCKKCNKEFFKYQSLYFNIFNDPYIICPYCKNKIFLNFKERS